MAAPPPTEQELIALAEQALGAAGGEAQATAAWEWALGDGAGRVSLEVAVLRGGRVGTAAAAADAEAADPDRIAAAAERAAAAGPRGLDELPAPGAARVHQGYDPSVLRLDPAAHPGRWRAGAAKIAVASSRGVRAFEQRSFAAVEIGGLAAAAVGPGGLDPGALAAEAAALGGEEPAEAQAGEPTVVLGPDAVAEVLDRLRPLLGGGGGLIAGARITASSINLSDSPRFGATLPRSHDVHGVPRQPVPLIQDGVAHRTVSAATGHALRPGRPEAEPQHLVLVGGGAEGAAELMAPIERGLYLPTLARGFEIERGRPARPVALASIGIDPVAVLAATQALSARQRTIATPGGARSVGATVAPALRATGGVRIP